MRWMPLNLEPAPGNFRKPKKSSVTGWLAVAFGILGIFSVGMVFVPLGFACSFIALFTGRAGWGITGLVLNTAGLLVSPHLLLVLGTWAVFTWFDWNDLIEPVRQIIRPEGTDV